MSVIFSYNTSRFEERIEVYENTLAIGNIRIAIPSVSSTTSVILQKFQHFFKIQNHKRVQKV